MVILLYKSQKFKKKPRLNNQKKIENIKKENNIFQQKICNFITKRQE